MGEGFRAITLALMGKMHVPLRLACFLFAMAICLLPIVGARALTVERVVSPGGIEAWLAQDHSNPILSMSFAFRGGAALDPPGKTGLALMVGSLLDEGAGDMDSQAFHGKLEDLAISLGYSAGEDALHGHLKTITANRDHRVQPAAPVAHQTSFRYRCDRPDPRTGARHVGA